MWSMKSCVAPGSLLERYNSGVRKGPACEQRVGMMCEMLLLIEQGQGNNLRESSTLLLEMNISTFFPPFAGTEEEKIGAWDLKNSVK